MTPAAQRCLNLLNIAPRSFAELGLMASPDGNRLRIIESAASAALKELGDLVEKCPEGYRLRKVEDVNSIGESAPA
jgi:hypothetical protein